MDIHQAAYVGDVEVVKGLLKGGIDPNCSHGPDTNWVSGTTPLNKVCIAWALTTSHIEVARLLIAYGAVVDDPRFSDLLMWVLQRSTCISTAPAKWCFRIDCTMAGAWN